MERLALQLGLLLTVLIHSCDGSNGGRNRLKHWSGSQSFASSQFQIHTNQNHMYIGCDNLESVSLQFRNGRIVVSSSDDDRHSIQVFKASPFEVPTLVSCSALLTEQDILLVSCSASAQRAKSRDTVWRWATDTHLWDWWAGHMGLKEYGEKLSTFQQIEVFHCQPGASAKRPPLMMNLVPVNAGYSKPINRQNGISYIQTGGEIRSLQSICSECVQVSGVVARLPPMYLSFDIVLGLTVSLIIEWSTDFQADRGPTAAFFASLSHYGSDASFKEMIDYGTQANGSLLFYWTRLAPGTSPTLATHALNAAALRMMLCRQKDMLHVAYIAETYRYLKALNSEYSDEHLYKASKNIVQLHLGVALAPQDCATPQVVHLMLLWLHRSAFFMNALSKSPLYAMVAEARAECVTCSLSKSISTQQHIQQFVNLCQSMINPTNAIGNDVFTGAMSRLQRQLISTLDLNLLDNNTAYQLVALFSQSIHIDCPELLISLLRWLLIHPHPLHHQFLVQALKELNRNSVAGMAPLIQAGRLGDDPLLDHLLVFVGTYGPYSTRSALKCLLPLGSRLDSALTPVLRSIAAVSRKEGEGGVYAGASPRAVAAMLLLQATPPSAAPSYAGKMAIYNGDEQHATRAEDSRIALVGELDGDVCLNYFLERVLGNPGAFPASSVRSCFVLDITTNERQQPVLSFTGAWAKLSIIIIEEGKEPTEIAMSSLQPQNYVVPQRCLVLVLTGDGGFQPSASLGWWLGHGDQASSMLASHTTRNTRDAAYSILFTS